MKVKVFKHCIVFAIMAFLLLATGLFFSFTNTKASAREYPQHKTYSQLINSYKNFSYDYNIEEDGELPAGYCLRDDYMIYTEQQSALGLCWNFGSAKALATTIEKATGEYVDFSEAWVSAAMAYGSTSGTFPSYKAISSSKYTSGSGGWFYGFDQVAKNYGLVLEQDFGYYDAYEITEKNASKYFEMYSQQASFNYIDSVDAGRFFEYQTSSSRQQIMNSIKNHIYNHGAVAMMMMYTTPKAIAYNSTTAYCVIPNALNGGGHLMAIVGWDDEISITYEGETYTGAWVVLNSHGNGVGTGGNQGILYVFYDDTNMYGSYWGYKYKSTEEIMKTEEIYYTDTIIDSNGTYETSLKGAYYGDMVATTGETKQKNIFFNNTDINITYQYTLSDGGTINNVSIYRGKQEVTSTFTFEQDAENKTWTLSGNDVKTGAYKVKVSFGDNLETQQHINQFFVCDGNELNYAYYSNNGVSIKNNGFYALYNVYNVEDTELVIATGSKSSSFSVSLVFATYNTITSIKVEGNTFDKTSHPSNFKNNSISFKINYNLDQKSQHEITFVNRQGKAKKLTIKLIYIQNQDTEVLAKVQYSTDGGINPNSQKVAVNVNGLTSIANPTRFGYKFLGWYYTSDFTRPLATNEAGQYCLEYSKLMIETSPEVYFTGSFNSYWKQFCNVFLYAKWENVSLRMVTFETNGGNAVESLIVEVGSTITSPTTEKIGFDFVGWFKDITLTDAWNFSTDTVNDNITLYAKFTLSALRNVKLSLINENAYVSEAFTIQLSFTHPLASQGKVSVDWLRDETALETTEKLTYSDTVFEEGTYSYSAKITLIYNEMQVEATAYLDVTATINLNAVTIAYVEGYKFELKELDTSITASYTINIYRNSEIINTLALTDMVIDISTEVTTFGNYYIGVVKQYNEETMPEVFSQKIEVFELSYENATDLYQTTLLIKGSIIEETTPTKEGYTFVDWYVDETACEFPFVIENNTKMIAKWQLCEITNALLEIDQEFPKLANPFELRVTYDHIIKDKLTLSVDWFKNGEKIAKTNTQTLLQTLSIFGDYEYYAVVILSDGALTTSLATQTISFKTTVVLSEIALSYTANGIFQINDPDNFASTYGIAVYKEGEEIGTFSFYKRTINISSHFIGSGKYSISVSKSFADQTLDPITSEEIELVKVCYSNITDTVNFPSVLVDVGTSLGQPKAPVKTGYDFLNWTRNGQEISFPYQINEDTELIAQWQLVPIKNLSLWAKQDQVVGKSFEIYLTFEHPLKSYSNISIDWFKDSELLESNNKTSLSQTLSLHGTYTYSAKLTLSVDGEEVFQNSNEIKVTLTYDLKNIAVSYLGEYQFMISDPDEYQSTYNISVFKNKSIINSFETNEKEIDISSFIIEKGKYNIEIVKSYAGQTLEGKVSNFVEVYQFSFINTLTNQTISSTLLEKSSPIPQPQELEMAGYTFVGWFDKSLDKPFDFTAKIISDLTAYAKFKLNEISVEVLTNIEFTYDAQSHEITARATHELDIGTYSYTWKKVEDNAFELNNQTLSVKNVRDSGTYYCEISFEVEGEIVYGRTNNMAVTINKAQTIIDTSAITKEYTYDGKAHTISSGAVVARENEKPEIEYYNNKFKDVPANGTLKLKITAMKTENYLSNTVEVNIKINPARLKVKINDTNGYWLFTTEKFSYEIVSGSLYSGDSLNESYQTTNDIGENEITMTTNNSNYIVEVVSGTNTISFIPHVIVATLLGTSIIFLSLAIIIKSKKAKKKASK